MLYLANPSAGRVLEAMQAGQLGMIATPRQGSPVPDGVIWCADNGCYGKGFPGDEAWLTWLGSYTDEQRERCLFATAPDVVGDAVATLERSLPLLHRVRELGFPVALVAQDGLEDLPVPWDEFDVLFIGGTTEWKLGAGVRYLVAEAKRHDKWVHMGRVNSAKRMRYAQGIGCDSVDGTFLIFGPNRNLPELLGWVRASRHETLF